MVVPKAASYTTANALTIWNEGTTTDRFCFNAPGLGTGGEGRLRDRIVNISMLFKYHLEVEQGSQASATFQDPNPITVIILIVLDTQNNATTSIDASEVIENDFAKTYESRLNYQRNMENTDRYKILKVIKAVLRPQVSSTWNGTAITSSAHRTQFSGKEVFINLKRTVTQFKTGASTPSSADIRDNAIKAIVLSNQDATDVRDVWISHHTRLRFQDM